MQRPPGRAARPHPGPSAGAALVALRAILEREGLRFLGQTGRLVSALVRPLVWLVVFGAGFRASVGLTDVPPYEIPVPYEVYILPGLAGMILLFNGMQSSLSLVYDREMGSMRLLLTAPLPRWWLLFSKLAAGAAIGVVQVYAFLLIAGIYGIRVPWYGYLAALPALFLAGLMLGGLGLVLSSFVRQLENFAGVMNFVIFPLFFLSSALYPLGRMAEGSAVLGEISALNPFTHAVEMIRFALYGDLNALSVAVVVASLAAFLAAALWGYDPARGMVRRKG